MLTAIKDYFKTAFGWGEPISIGKIDNNEQRAICFYNSRTQRTTAHTFGGRALQSYRHYPVTILLRYGKGKQAAQDMAESVFSFFDESQFTIDGRHAFALSIYDGPIDLGTDDNGVFEYSVELDIYIKKE